MVRNFTLLEIDEDLRKRCRVARSNMRISQAYLEFYNRCEAALGSLYQGDFSNVEAFYNQERSRCQQRVGEWHPSSQVDGELYEEISFEAAAADESGRQELIRIHQILIELHWLLREHPDEQVVRYQEEVRRGVVGECFADWSWQYDAGPESCQTCGSINDCDCFDR